MIVCLLCVLHHASPASGHHVVFGSHHKAGSTLTQGIASIVQHCWNDFFSKRTERMDVTMFSHFSTKYLRKEYAPVVHVVRDPAEMITSSYFYHLTTREKWAVRYALIRVL